MISIAETLIKIFDKVEITRKKVSLMESVSIYALVDPRNSNIFYVGRTKMALAQRLSCHMTSSVEINPALGAYKKDLKDNGLAPEIIQLDRGHHENKKELEEYWIQQCKAWNFRLTNVRHYKAEYKPRGHKESFSTAETKLIKTLYRHGDIAAIARLIGVSAELIRRSINWATHTPRVKQGVVDFYKVRAKEISELYQAVA